MTSQTTAVHHLCRATLCSQSLFSYQRSDAEWVNAKLTADLGIVHQVDSLVKSLQYHVSDFCFSPSFREPLRLAHIQEFTTTSNRCQALAVSRFSVPRFLISATAQVAVTVRILPQLGTAVNTSRSHVSVQLAVQQNNQFGNRQTKNNTLQCVIRNRHFASLRNHSAFSSLPQPDSVVKPSQYHVCESTRFSRSVCGFRARSPFPALTLVAYHNLERLSRPRSLAFPGLPFAVSRNRAGLSL